MNVGDRLTAKLGPLPVWAWAVLGAGVVTLGRYEYQRRKSPPVAVPPTDANGVGTTVNPMGDTGGAAGFTGLSAAPFGLPNAGGYAPAIVDGVAPSNRPASNAIWHAQAVEHGIASGQTPLLVETAISKYLNGDPLTVQEEAIVNIAFRIVGAPPEGAPTITRAPAGPSAAEIAQREGSPSSQDLASQIPGGFRTARP